MKNKILSLALVTMLFGAIAGLAADRVLVKLYGPGDKAGPSGWPANTKSVADDSPRPGWDLNITRAELDQLREDKRAEYEAWNQARLSAIEAPQEAKREELEEALERLETALDDWEVLGNKSPQEVESLVRDLATVALALKPIAKGQVASK